MGADIAEVPKPRELLPVDEDEAKKATQQIAQDPWKAHTSELLLVEEHNPHLKNLVLGQMEAIVMDGRGSATSALSYGQGATTAHRILRMNGRIPEVSVEHIRESAQKRNAKKAGSGQEDASWEQEINELEGTDRHFAGSIWEVGRYNIHRDQFFRGALGVYSAVNVALKK